MNKILIAVFILGFSHSIFAQLEFKVQPIELYLTESFFESDTYYICNTSEDILVYHWRIDRSTIPSDIEFRIKDTNACYTFGRESSCDIGAVWAIANDSTFIRIYLRNNLPSLWEDGPYNFNIDFLAGDNCDSVLTTLEVVVNDGISSITENHFPQYKIFPVPTSDILNIELPRDWKGNLLLTGTDGSVINKIVDPNVRLFQLDISSFSSGIYYLKFVPESENKSQVLIKRFVKT